MSRESRGLLLAAALAVLAVGCWTASWAITAPWSGDAAAVTGQLEAPVLSTRRIPQTLLRGAGTLLLDEQLDAVVDAAPERSCLAVQPGGSGPVLTRGTTDGLVPASTLKLFVTQAGLEVLGPDHRFTTRVTVDRIDADGTVGDLHLVGGGDPFLSTDAWVRRLDLPPHLASHTSLDDLADRVVAAGVRRVSGSVVGDSSHFRAELVETGPFVAPGPASALLVDEGFVSWSDEPGALLNDARATTQVTRHGAEVFAGLLAERGVVIAGRPTTGTSPIDAVEVASIESVPLRQVVTTINTFSSSVGAQMILHHLGLELVGVGSNDAGALALTEHLGETGLPMDGVAIVDGTGVSDRNRVTCAAVMALLQRAGPESVLADSLAVSGIRGTVGQRFPNSELRGLVRAKSGTLHNSRALAGFTRSWVDGRQTPFVLILNEEGLDYDRFDPWARRVQEDLLVALVQLPCVEDRAAFEALAGEPERAAEPVAGDEMAGVRITGTDGAEVAPPTPREEATRPAATPRTGDPSVSPCDDGQTIHGVNAGTVLIQLRYSPTCDTMWAKATFSTISSGAAHLRPVGYWCIEAERSCRSVSTSAMLDSTQVCADRLDESGTCRLPQPDQVWTEMLPAGLANVRACLGRTPHFGPDEPSTLELDACTPPAFEPVPGPDGDDRILARTRTACRTIRPRPESADAQEPAS